MKLTNLLTALGGSAAPVFQTASSLAVLVGAIYLVDCRVSAHTPESVDRCYFSALTIAGIGVASRGGYALGYSTYNPALRKPEEDAPEARRDSHGRFTRRDG